MSETLSFFVFPMIGTTLGMVLGAEVARLFLRAWMNGIDRKNEE